MAVREQLSEVSSFLLVPPEHQRLKSCHKRRWAKYFQCFARVSFSTYLKELAFYDYASVAQSSETDFRIDYVIIAELRVLFFLGKIEPVYY